eukprot:scaffold2404_cov398-Prasinococcus_capsulatus_cf.AAC.10
MGMRANKWRLCPAASSAERRGSSGQRACRRQAQALASRLHRARRTSGARRWFVLAPGRPGHLLGLVAGAFERYDRLPVSRGHASARLIARAPRPAKMDGRMGARTRGAHLREGACLWPQASSGQRVASRPRRARAPTKAGGSCAEDRQRPSPLSPGWTKSPLMPGESEEPCGGWSGGHLA